MLVTGRKVISKIDLRGKDFLVRVNFFENTVDVTIKVTHDEIDLIMGYEDWVYLYTVLKKASMGYAQSISRLRLKRWKQTKKKTGKK